jgi:hypothetical protein
MTARPLAAKSFTFCECCEDSFDSGKLCPDVARQPDVTKPGMPMNPPLLNIVLKVLYFVGTYSPRRYAVRMGAFGKGREFRQFE